MASIRVPAAVLRRVKVRVKTGDRAGALADLEAILMPPPVRASPVGQLRLAMTGLHVLPGHVFVCRTLGCELLPVGVCVARQKATDVQRMKQTGRRSQWANRGQASDYPHCDTTRCGQGRLIREALDPAAGEWKGAGSGWLGRFQRARPRKEQLAQEAAAARLERVGLLSSAPSLDEPPEEVER